MRVALVADTHGFLDPRLSDRIAECDVAVHAGDIGGADVLCSMQPQQEVIAVRGNTDGPESWPDHEIHMLENLPAEVVLDLPGGRLAVTHGDRFMPASTRHQQLRRAFPDVQAVAVGHSHEVRVDDDEVPWILNPGAAGRVRTFGGPSMLLLECAESGWSVETLRMPPRKYRAITAEG